MKGMVYRLFMLLGRDYDQNLGGGIFKTPSCFPINLHKDSLISGCPGIEHFYIFTLFEIIVYHPNQSINSCLLTSTSRNIFKRRPFPKSSPLCTGTAAVRPS